MENKFFKREELNDKLVVDQDAIILGKVVDLAVAGDGQVGLIVKGEGDKQDFIKLDQVKKIDDVVLLKGEFAAEASKPKAEPVVEAPTVKKGKVCPNCGHENKPDTRFCVKCGTALP